MSGWGVLRPSRKFIGRSSKRNKNSKPAALLVQFALLLVGGFYFMVVLRWIHEASSSSSSSSYSTTASSNAEKQPALRNPSRRRPACPFRRYPPHRYFKLQERPLPSFMTQTEYIYGEYPVLLPVSLGGEIQKLCVDQSEWWRPPPESPRMLPFADGTNPSILRIPNNPNLRLSVDLGPYAMYMATICMTNSQCAWKDTPEQIQDYHISTLSEPSTVRTVLLVLDKDFSVLEETTIQTLVDAKFGRKVKPKDPPVRRPFALDDARLFTYQQELWISYREGPNFGYDKQVLNRVHLERDTTTGPLHATLLASEVETLCCGRNMALLDNARTHQLQALTWVDPITVVDVDLKHSATTATEQGRRRLSGLDGRRRAYSSSIQEQHQSNWNGNPMLPLKDTPSIQHRRLSSTKKKSDFHGTNGFMVHLPATNEYLGIGHFHRPPGREANEYARFGHHYTHAFFTIPDTPPFHLKRLSPELVLRSEADPQDAEIIQFWSGLERSSIDDERLALAYGINDCEGAAVYIDMSTIEGLLRDVPAGKEVVDLLLPPKSF